MNDKTDLGSYYFIDICSKLTVILTIIAAIGIFIYGIVASTIFAWWYFIVVYLCGGFALVCFYFFNMLLISLCHNVYIIKKSLVNADGDVSNNNQKNIFRKRTKSPISIGEISSNISTIECPSCFAQNSPTATHCKECGCPLK